jgi:Cu/Ag efflux pump CusA
LAGIAARSGAAAVGSGCDLSRAQTRGPVAHDRLAAREAVIVLAGVVVDNDIILTDTCNELRKRCLAPYEAVLRTSARRLRPVLLTTVTSSF